MPCAALAAAAAAAQAVDLRFQRVAEGVYAYVGDKEARALENGGLNANIGLVVMPFGALPIVPAALT